VKKNKVCVIITTRGNYAKMKSVLRHLMAEDRWEAQVIVGGGALLPKYGQMVDSIRNCGFPIHCKIHFLVEGETPLTMAKSAGLAVAEFSTAFETLKPDVVIVIADRFESLAIAMAASYMNIPVAHVEGGEISGSIDESIRHAITKLAHVHFPATKDAAERIIRMGERPETVFPVGATSLDVIADLDLDTLEPLVRLQKTYGVGSEVDLRKPYIVVIQHPVTTEYEENFRNINETIQAAVKLDMGVFWIWPNMDAGSDGISKGIRIFREGGDTRNFHFFKSLPIEHFAPLLKHSACIIGNSSSGIRESAFLGVPAVNIGNRQNGRVRGINVADVPYDRSAIETAVRSQISHGPYPSDTLYGDGNSGKRIVEVLKDFHFVLQKQITY